MNYLLDTDHLSILQRQAGPEFASIMVHLAPLDPSALAFSIVSLHEQVLGCHTYINRAQSADQVTRGYRMMGQVLNAFAAAPVLLFDAAAASLFAELVAQGIRIGRMDMRIASIALSQNRILITRNARDFGRVPGLQFEDWTL